MYDYYLGGKDNFAADREAAERALELVPQGREAAQANRAFLLDAVRAMARAGIRQFLDLGTGIPTEPNVHETARSIQPGAKVIYVDNDPVVLAHNRALLANEPGIVTVGHDLRDPMSVLDDPLVAQELDLSQPVGVLMIAVLHFVELTAAPRIVARYMAPLASGSRIAITATSSDGIDPAIRRRLEAVYANATAPIVYRTPAQVEELFDGLQILPPGVVDLCRFPSAHGLCGVAVKP